MHKGNLIEEVNGYKIIDCNSCGFIHIDPFPSQEQLQKIYKDEYYSIEKPDFIKRQEEDLEWWNTVFDDRYDFFEETLSKDRRKILDIGCGPGFFLKRGKDRGWRGFGVEPSEQAFQHAKELGIKVENCFLDALTEKMGNEKYDVIHLSEVLEHCQDPTDICRTSYDLLSDGGIICIAVPNDYNPFQKIARENLGFESYWLAPPHHINYFTFDSLQSLLEKTGFKALKKEAMFPIDMFLLMGENYIGNDSVGRCCRARRKQFEVNLQKAGMNDFKRQLSEFFASKNIGREVVLFAQK